MYILDIFNKKKNEIIKIIWVLLTKLWNKYFRKYLIFSKFVDDLFQYIFFEIWYCRKNQNVKMCYYVCQICIQCLKYMFCLKDLVVYIIMLNMIQIAPTRILWVFDICCALEVNIVVYMCWQVSRYNKTNILFIVRHVRTYCTSNYINIIFIFSMIFVNV